jgi:hypothetical protein
LQPKNDRETFNLFQKHFIAPGRVDSGLTEVIAAGAAAAATATPADAFAGPPADVTTLVAPIRMLYENMDASLRLKPLATA